jgi:LysM repeat protein
LFSIARKYGVALVVMVENNPSAGSGLEVGSLVRVPYTPNKSRKTKEGIIHKVGQKETLYSISRQYGVTVDEIKSWNNLSVDGLKLGQELLIKNKVAENKIGPIVEVGTKETTSVAVPTETSAAIRTHTVAASETMYAISRKYDITIQQIKDWNNLSSNDLKLGQVIKVGSAASEVKTAVTAVVNPEIRSTTGQQGINDSNLNANTISVQGVVGTDEVHETGLAGLIEGTEGNRKYFAHHRSLKPGTIIHVKNNVTLKEVHVKVVGSLPPTEPNDVVLRLSKSALEKLGGDGKVLVEVIYFK